MKKNKIFWGLFFVLAAALIILNQLNIFTSINIISLLLTIFLVAILIKSIKSLAFPGIIFSLAFILLIYDKELGIEALTPWPLLLAATLLSIGICTIFGKVSYHHHHYCHDEYTEERIDKEKTVSIDVSFGASSKYITSKNLELIKVSCHFGDAKIYMDELELKENSAIIDLDVSFGGVEIYVPKNFKIVNKANCSFGSVDEKNKNSAVTDKELIINGHISFAGVEIIYV